jgi:hypothetical protein
MSSVHARDEVSAAVPDRDMGDRLISTYFGSGAGF